MVEGRVESVELFEDRAAITRVVPLPEPPGRHRLRIGLLSPLVRERAVSFLLPDDVFIEDYRVVRHRAEPTHAVAAEIARLQRERDVCAQALQQANDDRGRLRSRQARAAGLADAARSWSPRALVEGDRPLAWIEALRQLEDAHVKATLDAEELGLEVEGLQGQLASLDAELGRQRHDAGLERSVLELVVLVGGPGPLRVRYTIPCAVWRPVHRAILRDGRLRWQVGAMAWNSTGESWSGVRLICSTERPGTFPAAPALTDDRLQARRREKGVEIEAREEHEIELVGPDALPRQTDEIPGVDDGGEPRTCTVPEPVDLPADGRPVRVILETWETDVGTSWVAHPERSEQVVLRSFQPNGGARPLLAGPVDLIRDDTAVGRGRIGYVAPGASFAIGWGSHDALRITRRVRHGSGRARITGRQTHSFSVDLTIVHLGHEALEVLVRERLPVSEIAEVQVGAPEAHPPLSGEPDPSGLCTWRVPLRAGEARRLSLKWSVDSPANVKMPW